MLVYGIRQSHRRTHRLPSPCASCGMSNVVDLDIFQSYAHLFWIPFFPLRRSVQTECTHCRQVLVGSEMAMADRDLGKELASVERPPVHLFSGLILLGVLIPLAFWQSGRNDAAVRAKLRAPEVNDVYDVEQGKHSYTLYKVIDVRNDSVEVLQHNMETNKHSGLYRLRDEGAEGFSDERLMFALSDLQRLRDEGVIMNVER